MKKKNNISFVIFLSVFKRILNILFTILLTRLISKNRNEWIFNFLSRNGTLFIKLGQSLSLKHYIVGDDLAKKLMSLQEDVIFKSKTDVKITLENYFKSLSLNNVFEVIHPYSVASASIALIYRAKLSESYINISKLKFKEVAIKVVNKSFYEDLKIDILIITIIAKILNNFKFFNNIDVIEICESVTKSILNEFNLNEEIKNYKKLKHNLCFDSKFDLPNVIEELSSNEIVVMEWIDGFTLSKIHLLENNHINKSFLAKQVINLYCLQVYRDGFFHSDMHPGNLIYNQSNDKIYLIDCGNVSYLSKKDRISVAKILYFFLHKQYKKVVNEYMKAGYISSDVNQKDFTDFIKNIGQAILLDSGGQKGDMSKILGLIIHASNRFGIKTQTQLLMLQKAILYLEACVDFIDPSVDIWLEMKPWINNWFETEVSPLIILKDNVFTFLQHFTQKINLLDQ
jgi:ubiquinone biosynthesis protein